MDKPPLALLEGVAAFMGSRAILSASELDLFTFLHRSPATASGVAEACGLDSRATARLLDCLSSLGLLEKTEQTYRTTDLGAFFSSDHPHTLLPMVLHLNRQWRLWSDLTQAIRQGGRVDLRAGADFQGEDQKNFIAAMDVAGRDLAREIASSFDASRFDKLLDLGGASGTYTIAFLERNPGLRAVLFDLPEVIPLAEKSILGQGLGQRVEFVAGDFYQDELPGGCDLALLSAIIHQNGPEENVALYRKVLRALRPGGTLLIRDYIMDPSRTKPLGGALFALNMLVSTPRGDTYTFEEVKESLETAGFREVRQIRSGERMDSLVEARTPRA